MATLHAEDLSTPDDQVGVPPMSTRARAQRAGALAAQIPSQSDAGKVEKHLPNPGRGPVPASTLITVIVWLLVYLVLLGGSVAATTSASAATSLLPALVALLFALYGFIVQGKDEVNFSSVFSYAVALFIFFPAVYCALGLYAGAAAITPTSMLVIVTATVFMQAGVIIASPSAPRIGTPLRVSRSMGKGLVWISVLLMAFACVCIAVNLAPLATAAGSLAIYLAAEYVLASKGSFRKVLGAVILAVFSLIFLEVLFTGFGRLLLGAIGVGVIVLASWRARNRVLKWAMVISTIPGLIYMSNSRLQYLDELRGTSAAQDEGIGSVIIPFISLGKIWDRMTGGQIAPSGGESFFATLTLWIPKAVWPDKPVGFGAEIIPVVAPHLVGVPGYSDSATILGELLWGFGPFFALVGVLGLILIIRSADSWLEKQRMAAVSGVDRVMRDMLSVVLIAGLLNLVWGGTFTFASRALPQLALIVGIWLLARMVAVKYKPGPVGNFTNLSRR